MTTFFPRILGLTLCLLATEPLAAWVLNNPYQESEANKKIFYSSFTEQPKTLDPARSYSSNEFQFIAQIYEPLLDYDYFARPYQLLPLTTVAMPDIRYLNKQNQVVNPDKEQVAYSVYTLRIKPGILFQPHPALAKDKQGHYRYLNLPEDYLQDHDISQLSDFEQTGTRELLIDDYIYQIKRLANPSVNSPIYGLMSEHIVGFREFANSLPTNIAAGEFLDLRKYPLAGLKKVDDYTVEIRIYDQYAQFLYWLAMPFFSPMPWEADKFYSQPGMDENDLSLDWYPIGTGPFMLTENNPNRRMVLEKNLHYHKAYFPSNGSLADKKAGYLRFAGQLLPLIDKAIYTLEKESIPRWNKFLQGYYDISSISTDSFDQAIQLNTAGKPVLSDSMREKKMRLSQTTDASFYYLGFNNLDPIIGGRSERARKLRLAISIAVNYDENISIFYNGRGHAAQGPIPPGIMGHKEGEAGVNPYVYRWDGEKPVRRNIDEAKQLMNEAGYPQGRDPATGNALILHYDVSITGGPDDRSQLDWMRKQFARLGIDLDIRATQYNRFQEKIRTGNAQIFSWAWLADYPDPENFLFLLITESGKVAYGGENATNYSNPTYDALYQQMKNRPNDEQRQELIDKMVELVRHDAPLAWGINTETLLLNQQWVSPTKPNTITQNLLQYLAIDIKLRNQLRDSWNRPVLWPMAIFLLLVLLTLMPLYLAYYRAENNVAKRLNS